MEEGERPKSGGEKEPDHLESFRGYPIKENCEPQAQRHSALGWIAFF